MITAIGWSSVSYFRLVTAQTLCCWIWREQRFLSGAESLRTDRPSAAVSFVFSTLVSLSHSLFTSSPLVKAKCLSHNRLLYRSFRTAPHIFLMWFAEGPKPRGFRPLFQTPNCKPMPAGLNCTNNWRLNTTSDSQQLHSMTVSKSLTQPVLLQLHFHSRNPEDSDLHSFNPWWHHVPLCGWWSPPCSGCSPLFIVLPTAGKRVHVLLCSPSTNTTSHTSSW